MFICGAGLSKPSPSNLLSAVEVSRSCFDKYKPIETLSAALRDDIDKLAEHFFSQGQFERLFIRDLVPWERLVGEPNTGHAAIGDLLTCGAARGVASANFDTLIEQWWSHHRVSFRASLNGQEATDYDHRPLLKFHGCMNLNREATLWTHAQLDHAKYEKAITSCKTWMSLNLPSRDLVVVGFWTDWGYLNEVLAEALKDKNFNSVTVIDPAETAELIKKAPVLWDILSKTPHFQHLSLSGSDGLEEIRNAYSKVWVKKLYALGKPLFDERKGECPPELLDVSEMETEALYDLRRDAEGVAHNQAAKTREPILEAAQTALAHLLFAAKSIRVRSWYNIEGKTVRIVHGAGQGLDTVKRRFEQAPLATQADIVVCAGSLNQGVPAYLISRGQNNNVVRPEPGGGAEWLTLEDACARFNL